ncbi:GDSL-like Lipase/Acylhydrolase [Opitutaceae bacterium TAV1]|nr:GDSL-like Lipase/Acylhydrolase [Opitutaceae bacterium TAV1]
MQSVYIIGDSISVHYAPFLKKYLKGFLECLHREEEAEAALRNLDLPAGANAGDSSRVLEFLQAHRQHGGIDTDFLLLNCGLHDIRTDPVTGRKKTPVQVYVANLRAIIDTVVSMGRPRLIWMRTTPCDEAVHNKVRQPALEFYRYAADVLAWNEAADAVMSERGIPSIDLHTFTANLATGAELYCDHVHFPEHIREKQAAFIAGWLSRHAVA